MRKVNPNVRWNFFRIAIIGAAAVCLVLAWTNQAKSSWGDCDIDQITKLLEEVVELYYDAYTDWHQAYLEFQRMDDCFQNIPDCIPNFSFAEYSSFWNQYVVPTAEEAIERADKWAETKREKEKECELDLSVVLFPLPPQQDGTPR